jgi:hypothetical protein
MLKKNVVEACGAEVIWKCRSRCVEQGLEAKGMGGESTCSLVRCVDDVVWE